ncbi:MAG: transposase [Clostridia bacterium]|nr:transposase [Clostridia bacterium]
MPVPEEFRSIDIPKGLVIIDTLTNGPKRYAVRESFGSVRVPGKKNPQPKYGRVVGHIIDGKFVRDMKKSKYAEAPYLSYGMAALFKKVTDDIYEDLLSCFDLSDALKIIAMAGTKIIYPKVTNNNMSEKYKRTFLSIYYKGAALSKNTIFEFLAGLGKSDARIDFFEKRIDRVSAENHIAIDGVLKKDGSIDNELAGYSFKARLRGYKDINILYAYDMDAKEVLCSQVFPGNRPDVSCYKTFVGTNKIKAGILIGDKAFAPSALKGIWEENLGLHFISPLKKNSKKIEQYEMEKFDGVFKNTQIYHKKVKMENGHFLYSFKDLDKAYAQTKSYTTRVSKSNEAFDYDDYYDTYIKSGMIVFESDLDLPEQLIYENYKSRWLIELTFREYKNTLCLDTTNVHWDFSVKGEEFVNFIATLATNRITKLMAQSGLLNDYSYGDLREALRSAKRKVPAEGIVDDVRTDDACWVETSDEVLRIMETLGLAVPTLPENSLLKVTEKAKKQKQPKEQKPKHPRGRPKKAEQETKEKRPVGRPKKSLDSVGSSTASSEKVPSAAATQEKRHVGRPRKYPVEQRVKRPVGRPKKEQTEPKPKRPVGRPKKDPAPTQSD